MPNWNLGCGWQVCTVGAFIPTSRILLSSCLLPYWPKWLKLVMYGKMSLLCYGFLHDVMMTFETKAWCRVALFILKYPCSLQIVNWVNVGCSVIKMSASLYLNLDNVARKAKPLFILIAKMVVENFDHQNVFPELLYFLDW